MSAGGPLGIGIARLRDRVRFRSPVHAKGDTGQQKVTGYKDEFCCWAAVMPAANVRETESHAEQIAVGDLAVIIRGRDVLPGPDWQAVWNCVTLNVVAVIRPASGIDNRAVVVCREQQAAV